jgi:hypothetical protein
MTATGLSRCGLPGDDTHSPSLAPHPLDLKVHVVAVLLYPSPPLPTFLLTHHNRRPVTASFVKDTRVLRSRYTNIAFKGV